MYVRCDLPVFSSQTLHPTPTHLTLRYRHHVLAAVLGDLTGSGWLCKSPCSRHYFLLFLVYVQPEQH
jgi:hypothetical protein